MCKCNKSRKVLQNVIHMAERYEEVTHEEVEVYEQEEEQFDFTPMPIDKSNYIITKEGNRTIYKLKR